RCGFFLDPSVQLWIRIYSSSLMPALHSDLSWINSHDLLWIHSPALPTFVMDRTLVSKGPFVPPLSLHGLFLLSYHPYPDGLCAVDIAGERLEHCAIN
ncbi:hypothetical protein NEOLEDRAFT_1138669, partial [Neolentinus lepideus HHB14362 ss-1]